MKTLLFCLFMFATNVFASDSILNVFVWGNEIPDSIVRQFERDTGIKVNLSTYESNEAMYAKLKMTHRAYDIIQPSSYYIKRMVKDDLIEPIDKNKLPLLSNLMPLFSHPVYDKQGRYSVPLIWGATGIFVNDKYYDAKKIKAWKDLSNKRYKNQLLLIDDPREVFSMALLALGLSPNDNHVATIKQAHQFLLNLLPNIKLYASDAVATIIADEDARIGMAWNGDIARAREANQSITFIYPEEGFIVWSDNLAIAKDAPHRDNAYQFIHYCLRAEIAKQIALETGYAITNQAGIAELPQAVRKSELLYPNASILKRAIQQTDFSDSARVRYEHVWENLKTR